VDATLPTPGSLERTDLTADVVTDALRGVCYPGLTKDLVSFGMVEHVSVCDQHVKVRLALHARDASVKSRLEVAISDALRPLGAAGVVVEIVPPTRAAPPAARGRGDPWAEQVTLASARHVIAIGAGKGGVGKSTVAVNLALALAREGVKTALLDADIYGPSLPRMIGLSRKPEVRNDKMIPLQAWGLSCMSIGFLVDEETPMIWRGPMVMGALEQMMGQVAWGALDILVVDMPPGTGDAQLTMAQRVALTGAVIVSTPQDIALIDARRGVRMFEKTKVPVLGLVENMSFYCCPNCGHRADIFGHGGAKAEAVRLGTEFLGEIPLLLDIRVASDAGTPIAASAPESDAAKAYAALAARVWEKVSGTAVARAGGPRIVID